MNKMYALTSMNKLKPIYFEGESLDLNITEYKNISVPTASQTVLEFEPNDSVFLLPNW
jgi:hypothetical protein